jgi:hypothetical protein
LAILPYQFYYTLTGRVDVSVGWLGFLALGVPIYLQSRSAGFFRACRPARWYVLLLLLILAALVYSPNRWAGLQALAFSLTGLLALYIGYATGDAEGRLALRCGRVLGLVSIPLAVANVTFLVSPKLELAYLTSWLAPLLIEPDSLRSTLDHEGWGTILNPAKSGTVYLGPNHAAMFFGLLFWLMIEGWVSTRRIRWFGLAGLYLAAVLATGSRGGLLGLGVSALVAVFVSPGRFSVRRLHAARAAIVLTILLVTAAIFVLPIFEFLRDRLLAFDLTGRTLLWATALEAIRANPLLGLGFGGWESLYQARLSGILGEADLAPHNIVLDLWVWTGIGGAMAGVMVFLSVFRWLWERRSGMAVGSIAMWGMFSWVAVQSMFEPFPIGDPRVAGILWLYIGLMVRTRPQPDIASRDRDGPEKMRLVKRAHADRCTTRP